MTDPARGTIEVGSPRVATWGLAALVALLAPTGTGYVFGQDVTFAVRGGVSDRRAISPWIYGRNRNTELTTLSGLSSIRIGGNRLSAYNWETGASNAGKDFSYYSDTFLLRQLGVTSTAPGGLLLPTIQSTAANNQALLLTVPMTGFVSGDTAGEVLPADWAQIDPNNRLAQGIPGPRFKVSLPRKGSAFTTTPSQTDGFVYQDEFVNWVRLNKGTNRTSPVMYSLDNEPELWSSNHPELRKSTVDGTSVKLTYQELRDRSVAYASAIKDADPTALVFGPAGFGWSAFNTLNSAPDAAGRDFQVYYLQQMAAASQSAGKRLLDVLDIHYYPEARGTYADGTKARIVFTDQAETSTDPGMIAARVNAPRSLYDTSYIEESPITSGLPTGDKPIRLLQRTQAKIDANYAGTPIAITEYAFGGGNHISGAVAQADALGAFAANGVHSAMLWAVQPEVTYIESAFRMFRNFDGLGGHFGDISVSAVSSDLAQASVYASLDSDDPKTLVLVAINRTAGTLSTRIDLSSFDRMFSSMWAYRVTDGQPTPTLFMSGAVPGSQSFTYSMAPYSVNTIRLFGVATVPEPGPTGLVFGAALGVSLRRRRRA